MLAAKRRTRTIWFVADDDHDHDDEVLMTRC